MRIQNLLQLANSELPSTVRTVLDAPITLNRYEFAPLKYELQFEENVRKLSHCEAALLRILCENRNMAVQRKDILCDIWGDDSFFNSRSLDLYITKLCDYLCEDFAIEILTIKGVGYRFVVER